MECCGNPSCARKIQELEEELSRLRSVGFDMLKQRGDWQASGVKPVDLGAEFATMFTNDIEDFSEVLKHNTDMSDSEVRKFLCTTFQDVYVACKEEVLNKMRGSLSRILALPEEQESDEQLYDICRAYGLLLNVCGKSQCHEHKASFKKVSKNLTLSRAIEKELEELMEKMSQFSWKLLETIPPLVSETVSDALFQKDWHEKELSPEWSDELENYSLVYYRPVLFFSYEGKVSQKGWVGNAPVESETTPDWHPKSYKKPCLKIKQIVHSSEQASVDLSPKVKLKEPTPPVTPDTDHASSDGFFFGLKKYV